MKLVNMMRRIANMKVANMKVAIVKLLTGNNVKPEELYLIPAIKEFDDQLYNSYVTESRFDDFVSEKKSSRFRKATMAIIMVITILHPLRFLFLASRLDDVETAKYLGDAFTYFGDRIM